MYLLSQQEGLYVLHDDDDADCHDNDDCYDHDDNDDAADCNDNDDCYDHDDNGDNGVLTLSAGGWVPLGVLCHH